jgi:tetratricopeptide (TPR) repeat protein
MRRAILSALLLLAGAAGVLFYIAAAQEREYRRLIEQGQAALARDETFAAIEAFSGAIALKDDSMLGYLKRGETYRRRGDLTSAVRDLRTAARLDPSATRPLEQLADLNLSRQWYSRAADLYQEYLALDDRSPRILYKLGLARYEEGRLDAALDALRKALQLEPVMAEAHYVLGLCLRARAQNDLAATAFSAAIHVNPSFVAAREELADLYATLGRHRESIEQLAALKGLEPDRPDRQAALGLAYAGIGRTDLAVATLGAAVEHFPNEPLIYEALGRTWLKADRGESEAIDLQKAIEALDIASEHATSAQLALKGRALIMAGRVDEAERVLLEAADRFPVDPDAFAALATCADRLGHFQIARESLLRYAALTGDPSGVTVAARVADLSIELDEPGLAAAWYEIAVGAKSEPDAALLGTLASAQFRAGQLDHARESVAKALALQPGNRRFLALSRRLTTPPAPAPAPPVTPSVP